MPQGPWLSPLAWRILVDNEPRSNTAGQVKAFHCPRRHARPRQHRPRTRGDGGARPRPPPARSDSSPGVADHLHQGCVQRVLRDHLPLQQDAHALGLHPRHRVVVVPEQREAHHGHAVVHGLEDAVQASVAQEGFDAGVPWAGRQGGGAAQGAACGRRGFQADPGWGYYMA